MQPAPLGDYLTALSSLIQPVRASAYPPSLEPMERLLAALDHPERTFESIVVAGSVGKGTACLQIAGALGVTPGPVGLYTGPHLHSFRERLVVEGMIDAADLELVQVLNEPQQVVETIFRHYENRAFIPSAAERETFLNL